MVTAAMKLRHLFLGRKAVTNLDSIVKNRDVSLPTKFCTVKVTVLPVVMYRCESWTIKIEGWASKNWCFWTVMLEKTVENPLDCKEIKPVNPKGSQSWIFIGRTDADMEALILFGHLMWRIHSFEKTLMLGKIEGRRRRGWQDEMVGWDHWLNGHESEQTLGGSEGQGSLCAAVNGVAKSWTWLSNWTTTN